MASPSKRVPMRWGSRSAKLGMAWAVWCMGAGCSGPLWAGDWPQILGPNRDGVALDERLPERWPTDLPVIWEAEIGQGYAGAAVQDGFVVLFHRRGETEVVEAFDAVTGKVRWRSEHPATYRTRIDPDAGPRAVPTISQGRVVAWSPSGRATCLSLADGRELWTRELGETLRGDENYFGMGSAPLVVGDRVIFNVGGRGGAGVVALRLSDGEFIWKASDEGTSYAAPALGLDENRPVLIVPTRLQLLGLDPESGRELFRTPFGKTGPTVNAAVPQVVGDQVFVTASYGVGGKLLQWRGDRLSLVWESQASLSSQYFTPVVHGEFLYGFDGREDFSDTSLRCVELATGRVVWKQAMPGGHVIKVGDRLLVVGIDGQFQVVSATPEGYRREFSTEISEVPGRALPALAEGRLYVRTNASGGKAVLRCLDLLGESR